MYTSYTLQLFGGLFLNRKQKNSFFDTNSHRVQSLKIVDISNFELCDINLSTYMKYHRFTPIGFEYLSLRQRLNFF